MKKFFKLLLVLLLLCATVTNALAYHANDVYTYDTSDQAVPSANVYEVELIVDASVMGCKDLKEAQDIFVDNRDYTYILDSGNCRVVILDPEYRCVKELSSFHYQGETLTLAVGAMGLFYQDSTGLLYIADTKNDRIIVTDLEGNVNRLVTQPQSELLDASLKFAPRKLIVDNMGLIYVTTLNINTGALLIDQDNNFLGFYGTNSIKETFEIRMEYMWRSILTDEQNAQSEYSFQPTEFNNIFWSEDRFVYEVSPLSSTVASAVSKLNALGKNVFPSDVEFGDLGFTTHATRKPMFADITVDEEGVFTVLDLTRGRLYQYDDGCNLLAVFGGLGNQRGLFTTPVSIESNSENQILILDAGKNNITVMSQTYYGKLIRQATTLHNQGRYTEALEHWLEIIKMNANYTLAYEGLGKAYMKLGEYEKAKEYFKMASNKTEYSEARDALRSLWLRENFFPIAIVVITLMMLVLFSGAIKAGIRNLKQKLKQKKEAKAQ